MNYQFNVEVAKELDVNQAIFVHHLAWWVKCNKANNKHFSDGYYWTYNSTKAFAELFPFWTTEQVRNIIFKLEKQEIIKSSNMNKTRYDRTKWYTIINEPIMRLSGLLDEKTVDSSKSDHLVEIPNGSGENPQPIPYSKPNGKQKKKIIIKDSLDEEVDGIYEMYPTTCYTKKTSTGKSKANKTKIKYLLEKGGEGDTVEARVEWLKKSITIYLEECKKSGTWLKNFQSFLNNIPDYGSRTRVVTKNDRVNSHGTLIPNALPKISRRRDLPDDMKTFVEVEGVWWYFKEEWLTRDEYATR